MDVTAGSGFQPAMRALALSVIPENRRRSSMAADSSRGFLANPAAGT
jgi:hypothetical protein